MIGRVSALVGAVSVAALATGLGPAWRSSAGAEPVSTRPISVHTTLLPRTAHFGDPVVAQVTVDVDSGVVDPNSVRVVPGFVPFVESAPPVVSRTKVGRDVTYRYRYSIQCVSDGCLPAGQSRVVALPDVLVKAQAGQRSLTAAASWPAATVASGLSASDLRAGTPRFRHSASLPPPLYALPPGGFALSLLAIGALLGATAAILLGIELVALRRRRRVRAASRTPLETALAFVRDAARRRGADDRRKALELLAETLEVEGNPSLAGAAWQAAWAEQPPSPERALEVAEDVEALVGRAPA
jgi:hypothetical protein